MIADSELERDRARRATRPPRRGRAARHGRQRGRGDRRRARRARRRCRSRAGGEPRWVAVFSDRSSDVDDNVALIRRQILIAGLIALLARAGRRLARRAGATRGGCAGSRRAAEKVADGDFSDPIPVDSADEVGQLARTFNEMQQRLARPRQRPQGVHRQRLARAAHADLLPRRLRRAARGRGPDPEARAEFVRTMREQVERLTKLTADLLDLSKLDADAIEIRRERVDLGRARPRGSSREFGPRADRHGSRLDAATAERAGRSPRPTRTGARRSSVSCSTTRSPTRRREPRSTVGTNSAPATARAELTVTDDGPGHRPSASASGSSSASTPATRSAAPGSAWRSPASWRSGWTARSTLARRQRPHRVHARPAGGRRGAGSTRAASPRARRRRGLARRPALALARLRLRTATRRPTVTARRLDHDRRGRRLAAGRRSTAEDGAFDASAIYEAARPAWSRCSRSSAHRPGRSSAAAAAAARARAS